MKTPPISLRSAVPEDLGFVTWTLYTALSWNPDDPIPTFETVIAHPEIAIYHEGWMRDGDDGVVAELDTGEFVGMAYCRQFEEDEPAQAFVDSATPELAIGVERAFRGQGVGRHLIEWLHRSRWSSGVERMSLSVNVGNPAIHLYQKLGYREVRRHRDAVVMVADLDTRARSG